LVAGPLADRFFEPAMQPSGHLAPIWGGLFGTASGAGMALLYVLASVWMLLVGLGGLLLRPVRNADTLMPDRDSLT
jgi:MFS transporter, DHA3 family, macrolide efflux protein